MYSISFFPFLALRLAKKKGALTILFAQQDTTDPESEAAVFDGNRSGTPGYFDGDLDDVRIYERALSHGEIVNLAGVPVGGTLRQPLQPLLSTAADVDLYDDGTVDFKDFAVLMASWLDELLWPQP